MFAAANKSPNITRGGAARPADTDNDDDWCQRHAQSRRTSCERTLAFDGADVKDGPPTPTRQASPHIAHLRQRFPFPVVRASRRRFRLPPTHLPAGDNSFIPTTRPQRKSITAYSSAHPIDPSTFAALALECAEAFPAFDEAQRSGRAQSLRQPKGSAPPSIRLRSAGGGQLCCVCRFLLLLLLLRVTIFCANGRGNVALYVRHHMLSSRIHIARLFVVLFGGRFAVARQYWLRQSGVIFVGRQGAP